VPAQALALLNNPFVREASRRWAARVLAASGGSDAAARVRRLYELAYARMPSDVEITAALEFLAERGAGGDGGDGDALEPWADLCHVLMNVREFIFIR
jgi:hypothetical protein